MVNKDVYKQHRSTVHGGRVEDRVRFLLCVSGLNLNFFVFALFYKRSQSHGTDVTACYEPVTYNTNGCTSADIYKSRKVARVCSSGLYTAKWEAFPNIRSAAFAKFAVCASIRIKAWRHPAPTTDEIRPTDTISMLITCLK